MKIWKKCKQIMHYLFDHVKTVNDSKIFAALVILTLNLSAKFITLPISKTMESFVKNSFSQYILVFAMAWVGTRDIVISLFATFVFGVFMEFILNEKSSFCCLSEGFVTTQMDKLNKQDSDISKEEVETATKTFKKALKTLEAYSNLES
jgi:hypothetical protein